MRFRIEGILAKRTRWAQWHRWFAWYPVRVGEHEIRWLEFVQRRLQVERQPESFQYAPAESCLGKTY